MKLKIKYAVIAISAILLLLTIKMCEADDYTAMNIQEQEDLKGFEILQHESDSLLAEVLHEIDTKQHKYSDELNRLNEIILNDNLTVEEVHALKKQIIDTKKLLEEARNTKDTIVLTSVTTSDPEVRDSLIYNIIMEDSVEYNYILRDTIMYNIIFVDSVVKRTVYKIDTIYYNSDEIKKIKRKKG